jgi:hypothetical protein
MPLLPRYIVAALALCGLILATVVQRAAILRSSQEARLEVVPVDPRDLFRGDYVVLNYRIGRVDVPNDVTTPFTLGQQVFVTLRPDESNTSKAVAISAERPGVRDRYYLGHTPASPSTCQLSETGPGTVGSETALSVCAMALKAILCRRARRKSANLKNGVGLCRRRTSSQAAIGAC